MKTHQAKESLQAAQTHSTQAKRNDDQRTTINTQLQRQLQSNDSQQTKQLKQRFTSLQSQEHASIQRAEDEELTQAKFDTAQRIEEEEPAQRAALEEEPVQAKFDPVQRIEEEEPAQRKSAEPVNNTGLPNQLKAGIESMSGISMDHVKVHYNSAKPAQLNAHAYAQGSDIHVAPGQEQHVPHEAWHVVQQAQGRVKPTMQMKMGVPVNDDVGLETEADVMGAKALSQNSGNSLVPSMPSSESINCAQMLTGSGAFQRRVIWDEASTRNRYAPAKNGAINSSIYKDQYQKVDGLDESVKVIETEAKSKGEGDFSYTGGLIGGVIRIHPLTGEATPENADFNDNIATLGHEYQHAIDQLGVDKIDAFNLPTGDVRRWNIIHTEWRAWAIQAAINFQHCAGVIDEGTKINDHSKKMLLTYLNPEDRTKDGNHFLRKTHTYINEHVFLDTGKTFSIEQTREWMLTGGSDWWLESIQIFKANAPIVEALPVEPTITIDEESQFESLAPGLIHAGNQVEKVRRTEESRIFRYKGKLYSVKKELMGLGYFDSASGAWL